MAKCPHDIENYDHHCGIRGVACDHLKNQDECPYRKRWEGRAKTTILK